MAVGVGCRFLGFRVVELQARIVGVFGAKGVATAGVKALEAAGRVDVGAVFVRSVFCWNLLAASLLASASIPEVILQNSKKSPYRLCFA